MKKRLSKWYQKDEHLRAFMSLLEGLEPEIQCEIAVDMIIKISEISERDYKKMIEEVGNYNPKKYSRWYDKNPNMHLAIESLKDIDEKRREIIIKEFSEKVLSAFDDNTLGDKN